MAADGLAMLGARASAPKGLRGYGCCILQPSLWGYVAGRFRSFSSGFDSHKLNPSWTNMAMIMQTTTTKENIGILTEFTLYWVFSMTSQKWGLDWLGFLPVPNHCLLWATSQYLKPMMTQFPDMQIFKYVYELLILKALKISMLYKNHLSMYG